MEKSGKNAKGKKYSAKSIFFDKRLRHELKLTPPIKASQSSTNLKKFALFLHFISSLHAIKPIFAAENSVKPIGIYIFLAKDLDMSKKSCNFAAKLVEP